MLDDDAAVQRLTAREDALAQGSHFARVMREGRAAVEFRFRRPDGGYAWLRNEAVVTERRPDGSAEVTGAVTNITHERELAARAALQSRMATLGELATSLAHELTQPITVIGMAAAVAEQVAVETETTAELRRQITSILAQTDRAGDMIRHLRSYGHADGGPISAVCLRQAVDGALTLVGSPLREASVRLEIELPPGLPAVSARLVQVEQVLVNLMINARDAMRAVPAKQRVLHIHGSVARDSVAFGAADSVRLVVSDTGPGISDSVRDRLFDAFFTTKGPGEGTGLGLALSQTIMRGFNGRISVTSPPSRPETATAQEGASFLLEFRIAPTMSQAGMAQAGMAQAG